MTPNYTKIVADAKERYSPNYMSVEVKFESCGSVIFRVALSMQAKDEMVHMHDIKEAKVSLEEAIEEAVRRAEFDNGRAPTLVTYETLDIDAVDTAVLGLSPPPNTGN